MKYARDFDQLLRDLLAELPLAPVRVLAPFVDAPESTLHRHVKHLVDTGHVYTVSSPLRSRGRPSQLLYLSRVGLARARAVEAEPRALARKLALAASTDSVRWLSKQLPALLAAYELLELLAARGPGPASLHEWQWPWRWVVAPRAGIRGAQRVVRLRAAAAIVWSTPDGSIRTDYALVPDTGGLAQPALRPALRQLARYQATAQARLTLAVATTTPRRAAGWAALVKSVCQQHGLPMLEAEIATWTELRREAARAKSLLPIASRDQHHCAFKPAAQQVDRVASPRVRLSLARRDPSLSMWTSLGPLDRAVLDLVARHPFLPCAIIGDVLGNRGAAWSRTHRATLVAHDLVRVVPAHEVDSPALARLRLLEATHMGLAVLAANLGMPLMAAVRHHGLAGGGPGASLGPRATLVRHLQHTLGADGVFAAVARAARGHPLGGALLEWRGPAACAHGRLRPDGYGLLRLGARQYGFFLEFDRGSMHAGRLRAKFTAYHRYAATVHASRSYAGFPTILVVSCDPGSEQRIARAIVASDVGHRARLTTLLTTTAWLDATPAGPLGSVWRTASGPGRRVWPCDSIADDTLEAPWRSCRF